MEGKTLIWVCIGVAALIWASAGSSKDRASAPVSAVTSATSEWQAQPPALEELAPSAEYRVAPYSPLTFAGRECTNDCSGHEAGYEWAGEQGITDPGDCSGNSQSFVEGCDAYAEEHQEEQEDET